MPRTPYDDGFAEGSREDGGDSRSCPWESTENVNRWMDGLYAARAQAAARSGA